MDTYFQKMNGRNDMKIAAGIIIFNSDFVLQQVLESIYPHMDQILVAEGPVKFWQDQGHKTSSDRTNEILNNFPDPDEKIIIVRGQFAEKTEQANAYMKHLNPDIDYIWNIDADEVFRGADIQVIKGLLEREKYTSVGFRSRTFFGGFSHYLTGFEEGHEFMRIRKVYPGSTWDNHRPPTIKHVPGTATLPEKHLSYSKLADMGIFMYHYSYVFARQVKEKVFYYENAVISPGKCIPDYFNTVWKPWVLEPGSRSLIERKFHGVHEFTPDARGECFTAQFNGTHPEIIQRDAGDLLVEFEKQLNL